MNHHNTGEFSQPSEYASPLGKASSLTRVAMMIARSEEGTKAALATAERSAEDFATRMFLRTKAGSVATTTNPDWGSVMADGAVAGFVAALRPLSTFYRMAELAVPAPMRQRMILFSALATPDASAEGAMAPVLAAAMAPNILEPATIRALVVGSMELFKSDDPAATDALSLELINAVRAGVDREFFSVALDGLSADAATEADLSEVLRAALDRVSTTGTEALAFVAHPSAANWLATVTDIAGNRQHPLMGPAGGLLVNVPCWVSDELAPGQLILMDARGFTANPGSLDVRLSENGDVRMVTEEEPTPTAVSLWQNNLLGIAVIARIGVKRMRANATALISLPLVSA